MREYSMPLYKYQVCLKHESSSCLQTVASSLKSKSEARRLNKQYDLLSKLIGTINDECMIKYCKALSGRTLRVLELATGTGIWLQKMDDMLRREGIIAEFDGTDIDNTKFLKENPDNIKLTTRNMFDAPDSMDKNKYDVVYLRFALVGIPLANLPVVIDNCKAYLRPGGYLFWEDMSWADWKTLPFSSTRSEPTKYTDSAFSDIMKTPKLGKMCSNGPFEIQPSLISTGGFENTKVDVKHSIDFKDGENVQVGIRENFTEVIKARYSRIYAGNTSQMPSTKMSYQTLEAALEGLNKCKEEWDDGSMFDWPMMILSSKKASMQLTLRNEHDNFLFRLLKKLK